MSDLDVNGKCRKGTYAPATTRASILMPFVLTSGSKTYFSSVPVTPRSSTWSAKNLMKAPYALLGSFQLTAVSEDFMALQRTSGSQDTESSFL